MSVWQKCQMRLEPTLFYSSLVKSESTWLLPEFKFEAREEKEEEKKMVCVWGGGGGEGGGVLLHFIYRKLLCQQVEILCEHCLRF